MTLKKSIGEGFGRGELYDILKWNNGAPYQASFTVGAESGTTIDVAIQLKDYLGNDLANAAPVFAYISSDAAGLELAASGCTTDAAGGTDGKLLVLVAKTAYLLVSEADGDIDVRFTDTGSSGFYLNLIMANGKIATSGKIQFTA